MRQLAPGLGYLTQTPSRVTLWVTRTHLDRALAAYQQLHHLARTAGTPRTAFDEMYDQGCHCLLSQALHDVWGDAFEHVGMFFVTLQDETQYVLDVRGQYMVRLFDTGDHYTLKGMLPCTVTVTRQ